MECEIRSEEFGKVVREFYKIIITRNYVYTLALLNLATYVNFRASFVKLFDLRNRINTENLAKCK